MFSNDNDSVIYNDEEEYDSDRSTVDYINSYVNSYTNSSYNSCNSNSIRIKNSNSCSYNSYENRFRFSYEDKYMENKLIIKKIKYNKSKSIQKKNIKLQYKLVLNELHNNNLKNEIYKKNFSLVLNEILLKELKIYYPYGQIYKKMLDSL